MYTMSMKRLSLMAVLAFLIFAFPIVSATITVTVTAPSSVTQGSSVPVTASFVAGEEGDSGTFYMTCDQTVSGEVDPEDGYNVLSSTSKTYTFTPGTAQTYSNCKVSDGGTQSSSTFVVSVVAPSSLTVSGSPSSTTNSSGDTFPLSISITNPTGSSVTTSYSLSCPSGYTCSGDSATDTISISAGTTTNLEWTVTVGSSSGTVSFQLGSNSNAHSTSVTVSSATTTTLGSSGSGGGGGGGGGGAGSGSGVAAKVWTKLMVGETNEWKISSSVLALTGIEVDVKQEASTVRVTAGNLSSRPSEVSADPEGKVYQYLNLTLQNMAESNLNTVKIKFKVSKEWLTQNNLDKDTVALHRYVNGWNKLPTVFVSEDDDYIYYSADSPGFSYFSVAAQEVSGGDAPGDGVTTTTTPGEVPDGEVTTTTQPSIVPKGLEPKIGLVVLLVVLFLIGAALFFFKPKDSDDDDDDDDSISGLKRKFEKLKYKGPKEK